ncbi:MAG: hypothetical protein IT385_10535 [Deltaproteobacteria bacterium]|nr:hypothetical protein [Deltaproteobacteria bacterium]
MVGSTAEATLETIVNCIADAVLVADPSGHIVLANKAAHALLESSGNPEARDLKVCHSPDRWETMIARLANPAPQESHPLLRVGRRTYEATWGRVSAQDGSLYGAVMVARDVTERLEEQVTREQRERMATIGKLAAALAHELNNPLGSIALYAQHAQKRVDPQGPLYEHLGTVLRNASLCKRIVRDLLEYARQRPPEKRAIDPADVLRHAARTLEPHAERHGVTLRTHVGFDVPEVVRADGDQLGQVLVNLGLNAIEAMAPSGVPEGPAGLDRSGTLHLELVTDGSDTVVFRVVDDGPGIPLDRQEAVFSPFFTTKAEGTGLGLSVATDLVSAHGGRLTLVSAPGQGCTFTVRLPVGGGP